MIYLRLFLEFFHTGLFSVGGGYATLPFLYNMADRTGWFTAAQIADMLAVSESTPGPIGVNMATYAGYSTAGIGGALAATLGLVLPSVIVILIVAAFLQRFRQSRWVDAAFYGLRPASSGLICAAALPVMGECFLRPAAWRSGELAALFEWKAVALAAVLAVLTNIGPTKRLHPVWFLLASAAVGIGLSFAGV